MASSSSESPSSLSSSPLAPGQAALLAGILCYLMWGFIPLVFQQMAHIGAGPWEIMANRTVWGLVWAALLVLIARQSAQVWRVLTSPRLLIWLTVSAALIAFNWTIYVVAVNNGMTLDASLGYYLNPLLNMAAGAWLFREKIDRYGAIAIVLAGLGVVLQAVALGHAPWISISLAVSFCAYGVIRKRVEVDAQTGLFTECLILAVPGLAWLMWVQMSGQGHLFASPTATFWLMFAGPATVAPLALFAWAARRMPLSSLGFLQFLAPTIVFFIGMIQGEPLGALRIASFAFIWIGAAAYALGAVIRLRRRRPALETVIAPEPGLIEDEADERSRGGRA